MTTEPGCLEGEACTRDGCHGTIQTSDPEGCSCHQNAPCGACITPREHCDTCEWNAEDEQSAEIAAENARAAKMPSPPPKAEAWWTPRPLDKTKIDYRIEHDSTCSQKCVGVYPLDPSKTDSQIRAEIEQRTKGTFGGRFLSFGHGRFEYRAMTD